MSYFAHSALDVHISWAKHNRWLMGQAHDWPCYAHCLWLVREGEIEVWSSNRCWRVLPGQAFLWPQNKERRIVAIKDSSWFSVGLSATTLAQADLFDSLPAPATQSLSSSEQTLISSWMQTLVEVHRDHPVSNRSSHFDIIENSLARAVVAWCWGLWGPVDLNQALHHQAPAWLVKTLEQIREDPTVSIADLAKSAGFSPAQFRRLFHQNMKEPPQKYLLRHRIKVAQNLLERTDLTVTEVAFNSGFPTPTNFMNQWKRTHGMSALQYRFSQRAARQMGGL